MRRHDERGAVIVLVAFAMFVLIAMAAVVIDLANARQWRRQAQNTADAAALAAAQDLPQLDAAVATVKQYTTINLGTPEADWAGCQDSEALALTPDAGTGNRCISFSSDRKRVRVHVPARRVPTFFGTMLQLNAFSIRAAAIAAVPVSSLDRIIPAAVSGPMGTGLLCIEQAGANQPCAARERGQFGSLASPRLNVFQPSSNVDQTSLAINYAMNVDHDIGRYAGGAAVCDGRVVSPCTANNVGTGLVANHVNTSTGNDVPPVTEGYITGFTAKTTDRGTVSFCGRLQRPDTTAANLLEPAPGDCAAPGMPTTTILGRTVNGRHVYFWLTAGARQLFYPEVVTLGYADTDPRLAIGNPVYANGDARLDCFLAGFRYDTATKTETLPDCTSVGLVYPTTGGSAWQREAADLFTTATYSANDGTASWGGPWTETGDDNTPTGGKITIAGGNLEFNTSSSNRGDTIRRSVSMTHPSGQLATSAQLEVSAEIASMDKAQVALEVSTDGTAWTTLTTYYGEKTSPPGFTTSTFDLTPFISPSTWVRFNVVSSSGGSTMFRVADIRVVFGAVATGPPAPVAPIFAAGMQNDPRWGVIPRVSAFATPSQAIPVTQFWGFYGYKAYTTSTKVQAFDAWVFDPALLLPDPATDSFGFGYTPGATYALIK